ncbi:MAG: glycosyltransferase family 2 protein [Acidimicrobiales bacterium]
MTAEVSVVVVTWNSREVILGCLASLAAHPPARAWEAIVVDNASADGTADLVRAGAPWARLIANPTNRGLPAANNQGLVAAVGDDLLIANPDVVFSAGAVDALAGVLDRRPRAGWVVPRLHYPDGRIQTSAGDLPRLHDAVLGRQAGRRRRPGLPQGFWWDGWAHDEERPIGRGHEAAYMVRRAAVAGVGLQDEHYVLDWEGLDWTDRFRRQGWEIWLAPDAHVVHLGGTSVRQVPLRWVVSQHRGMYRYFSRRRPVWWRPALAAVFGVRAGVKLAAMGAGLPLYDRAHRDRRDQPGEPGAGGYRAQGRGDPTPPLP